MRLIVIDSSSKQNATVIEMGGNALLFDCGVSRKHLLCELECRGISEKDIKAVFVTHDHSDHTKGLSSLQKHLNVPYLSGSGVPFCEPMTSPWSQYGFTVSFFDCSHDTPCVGYKITCGDKSVCIATDTGVITDSIKNALIGCQTVMIESNHDLDMLMFGHYPPSLKSRIASPVGHLSNADCAKFLTYLAAHGKLKRALLAHLSENNNTPLVAKSACREALSAYGFDDIEIICAASGVEIEI